MLAIANPFEVFHDKSGDPLDAGYIYIGVVNLPIGAGYTTVETKGNFARPITGKTGRVRAEARAVAQGRQIISSEARVLSTDGKVLAHGTSTILVLSGAR